LNSEGISAKSHSAEIVMEIQEKDNMTEEENQENHFYLKDEVHIKISMLFASMFGYWNHE
jgi:hypothetical protein